ncbi:beta-hexosaminidase subunit beta-like [Anneissia japonica]|uniref:beta-hexosaminidase subunit beta-like n=1 Tax=Anneissia japonica TaxID=1529436 RepID=UPI001425AD84|nr:beta-hexosaminidase subunit beta-like [Anneissia japonica]
MINATSITDYPRYKHRGFLLDTARHYMPLPIILKHLDAMSYNKFNVFHWHLVDHQAFPFVSRVYPELSEKGAYHPQLKVYKPDDVTRVIEYARLRGIRVIPELDTPGHMESWGRSHPEIITMCYENGEPFGRLGTINPIKNETYTFVRNLFREIVEVFSDDFVHLGADEVTYDCWKSNPEIQAFMNDKSWNEDYSSLEELYQTKLFQIITDLKAKYIIWQDPIDNNVTVNQDTIVQVWKDPSLDPILPPYREGLEKVTKLGLKTILSAPWYLNYISYGPDWKNFYQTEPEDFNGTAEQKKLLIGGEACMWAEYVDGGNVIPRIWPRAAAIGERLWSANDVRDVDMANVRLDQQRCRMVRRGINAEPIAPGYCGRYEYAMNDPWGSDQTNEASVNTPFHIGIIYMMVALVCFSIF